MNNLITIKDSNNDYQYFIEGDYNLYDVKKAIKLIENLCPHQTLDISLDDYKIEIRPDYNVNGRLIYSIYCKDSISFPEIDRLINHCFAKVKELMDEANRIDTICKINQQFPS